MYPLFCGVHPQRSFQGTFARSWPNPIIQSYPIPSHQGPKGTWYPPPRTLSRSSRVCSYVHHLEKRIADLERLLCEVCTIPSHIHHTTLTPKQYSSRGGVGGSYGRALTNSRMPGEHHGLGPLPASAYSKPEDMDPLSLLAEETSDSDDEFFSEKKLGAISPEANGEHTSCFYGKSSLLAFTSKAFDERGEAPPTSKNRTHAYRKEFWITPDVIPSK